MKMSKSRIAVLLLFAVIVFSMFPILPAKLASSRSNDMFQCMMGPDVPGELNGSDPSTWIYRDTTNPYKNWTNSAGDPTEDPKEEWGFKEAWRQARVVLAIDEEALNRWGIDESVRCVERGDEALVALYNIDINITNIVPYQSDDSIEWMSPDRAPDGEPTLYDEAFDLLKGLFDLRNGDAKGADIIIAVTGQNTIDELVQGLAPRYPVLAYNTMIMVRWPYYWINDNLVQHEVAHCYDCPDHEMEEDIQCAMARKTDWVNILVEDGQIFVWCNHVHRSKLLYDWCETCDINLHDHSGGGGGGGGPWRNVPYGLGEPYA
jgi:hypothetical protein